MTKPLTKAQARALKKWFRVEAANPITLGVRDDVYLRLLHAGHLKSAGFLFTKITAKGEAALSAYEQKHGEIKKDWF